MGTTQNVMTLCCREQWAGAAFHGVERSGDALVLSAGAVEGYVLLPPVDAGEAGFPWGRIQVEAELPGQSGLRIYALASDGAEWPAWALAREQTPPVTPEPLFGPPAAAGTEAWLSLRGQRLWLGLALTGSGVQRPRIDAVRLWMGGEHLTDYLPAIYQGQDFTYRFLSVFTAMFQDMEQEMEAFPRQLDPAAASPEMLEYLAVWLCLEGERDPDRLRQRLGEAIAEYEQQYTPEGIRRSVERLTGRSPGIIEHFSVDPNAPDCSNPALNRRLYGDNPYRFFLLLPQDTFSSQRQLERFLEEMRELIPAETEFELMLLKPCVQLDWQSYLGMNTVISGYRPAVIDETATIHYDTTIGGTPT